MQIRKILLSTHCKTYEQKAVSKALVNMLLSKDYCIDLIANFDLDIPPKNVHRY